MRQHPPTSDDLLEASQPAPKSALLQFVTEVAADSMTDAEEIVSFATRYALLTDLSNAITWNKDRVRSKSAGWIIGACEMVGTALAWLIIWAVVK